MPRPTLTDRLKRPVNDPDDESVLALRNEILETVQGSVGFRWSAPSTQARQDLHLSELIQYYRLIHQISSEVSTDEVKGLIFSQNTEGIITSLKEYFTIVAKLIVPRSKSDDKPRFQNLIQRRLSMIFWMNREMGERAPSRASVITTTNPALQWAARKYGINRRPTSTTKMYLGRHELAQLLEQDMFQTSCLPLAENHHLAWTLAHICGVRPGTMAEATR